MTGTRNSDDIFLELCSQLTMGGSSIIHKEQQLMLFSIQFAFPIVEDPNEEFSDLRDKNDMKHLDSKGVFTDLQAPVKKDRIEQVAATYKLTKVRRFSFVVRGIV